MLRTELPEIIDNGENSGVAFKRDDLRPEQLAKEIVGMVHTELTPFYGTDFDCLDQARLKDYVVNIIGDEGKPENRRAWEKRLAGIGFMRSPDRQKMVNAAARRRFCSAFADRCRKYRS
jgi:hypothetical protein